MMVLRLILKGIFKVYFRLIISSLMKSVDNLGKRAIKFNLGLRLSLFFTSKTQYLVGCPFYHLCIAGFKGRKE